MAEPITWRSLAGASMPVTAAQPLLYAQQAMNDGFSTLNKVLENRQAIDASNWEAAKQNNTQAFLDKLASYRTPEEFAAAQASGELDALRAGFGAQIDRAQTRNAAENRLDLLRSQARSALAYNNDMTDAQQMPIMEKIKALAADGSDKAIAEANALIAAHPELRHLGQAAEAVSNGQRANIEFGWKGDKRQEESAAAADALLSAAAQRAHLSKADANDAARLGLQREQQDFLKFKTGQELLTEAQNGLGAVNDNLVSSAKGSKQVLDTLEKMVPKGGNESWNAREARDAFESLMQNVGRAMADPANRYLTVDQMVGLALDTKDTRAWGTRWARDGNRGNDLERRLEALRNSPGFLEQRDQLENLRIKRQNTVEALRAAIDYGAPKKAK